MNIPSVDIVVPVYNEAATLERSVRRLRARLDRDNGFRARVIIADNGSADATATIAARLTSELPGVMLLRLAARGRGRALRAAWMRSSADVVAYMDVDLSTDLDALAPLISLIASGRADLAIGSRLVRGARVTRGLRREVLSRGYNRLLRFRLGIGIHDAQCGFKALRTSVAHRLLPSVANDNWFFDTELVVRAERAGYRVRELPVTWTEDRDSRVRIVRTAWEDLRGIERLRAQRGRVGAATRRTVLQLLRFAGVGLVSTAAYIALYDGLRDLAPAATANAIALLVTAVANTALNRRFTFGIRGTRNRLRDHAGGLATFLLALAMSSVALLTLHAIDLRASEQAELITLLSASAAATGLRFTLLRALLLPAGTRAVDLRGHPAAAGRAEIRAAATDAR